MIKGKTGSSRGLSGAPTTISLPWDFKRPSNGNMEWAAETVSIMPSSVPLAAYQIIAKFMN